MHATQLAQIAASFATMSHALTGDPPHTLGDTAHGYWLASRFRCDAWHQRISTHRSAIEHCGTSQRKRLWREILPTLQEILVSEPLSRIIAYLAGWMEKRKADSDWGALAHSVLSNHVDARHRCLNLMVFGHGLSVESAVGLNRLRRVLEYFNDQLLGSLPPQATLDTYAFEPKLVASVQCEFRLYPVLGPLRSVRIMSLAMAVKQLLSSDHRAQSANPQLNESIAEAALAMWPPAAFDSLGVLRGPLQLAVARDVQDRPICTDDYGQPLAAPFDLLLKHARKPHANATRRF